MKLANIVEKLTPKELTAQIFGDTGRPSHRKFIKRIEDLIIKGFTHDPKTGAIRFNRETISKSLSSLGYSDEKIKEIRNITIAAAKKAQSDIIKKYPEISFEKDTTFLANKQNPNSFAVYDVFSFNSEWEPQLEFNKFFRQNLEKLLEKRPHLLTTEYTPSSIPSIS